MQRLLALAAAAFPVMGEARTNCLPKDILIGYLRDKGMTLHAWGLDSTGDMQELFLSDGGNFVVVSTTPGNCVAVSVALDREGGRLWSPPRNSMDPNTRLSDGEPG